MESSLPTGIESNSTKTSSQRKILISVCVGILLIVTSIVIWRRFFISSQTVTVAESADQLSVRSQEFLQAQQRIDDSTWYEPSAQEQNPEQLKLPGEWKSECFGFSIPFTYSKLQYSEENGTCYVRMNIDKWSGALIISIAPATSPTLSEDTGVILRRSDSDLYSENQTQYDQFEQSLQFQSEKSLITFLREGNTQIIISFIEILPDIEEQAQSYTDDIVESLVIHN